MNISIDGRAAFFYKGTGIGNYSSELINNISKLKTNHSIDICSKNSHQNLNTKLSFWEIAQSNLTLNKKYNILLNPHNGIGLPNYNAEKIATTLHDIIPSKMPNTVSDKYIKIYNNNIHSVFEKSNLILTVSNFSKNDIIKTFNIKKDKIKVTYLAPNSIYKPLDKTLSKNLLQKKYNINFNYILYIGGFSPRKNILGLIEAFSKISTKNIKLLIIGNKGKSYELYSKRVQNLNLLEKVFFTGFIETLDLPLFYNNASLFIYPSFYEGFGLPPLEAMACNTPVLASNQTSIPEILKDSPIYIDPYDINDISTKIDLVLNDSLLSKNLKEKGLNHVKNFSWKKTSSNTLRYIENI